MFTQARLYLTQRAQHPLVGVKHLSVIISDAQVGRNAIERYADAQIVIRNPKGLGNVESLLNLHGLKPLKNLAQFVVPRHIDIARKVVMRQCLKCVKNRIDRTGNRANNPNCDCGTNSKRQEDHQQYPKAFAGESLFAIGQLGLPLLNLKLEQIRGFLRRHGIARIDPLEQNQIGLPKKAAEQRFLCRNQAIHNITLTGLVKGISHLTVLFGANCLLVKLPLQRDLSNICVDLLDVKIQWVVMQAGIRTRRVMLQGQQHLRMVIGHQLADRGQGLRGLQAIVIKISHRPVGIRHSPDTQASNQNHCSQQHTKPGNQPFFQRPTSQEALAALDHFTMTDLQPPRFLLAKQTIGAFGSLNLLPSRLATNRHVASDLTVFANRCRGGQYPVMVTIFATILDHASPGATILEVTPHIDIGLRRHIGMAHNIVGLPDQLSFGKPADINEIPVYIGDLAFLISLGDDQSAFVQLDFNIAYWQVVSHEFSLYCTVVLELFPLIFIRGC